ncbi:MAG TPA: hypothetical protein VH108_03855 [Gaiellaceae bacterium]|jgi:hypothetical protein|nr:hypothetical protein [Gaiellaceae bacterium]
MAQPYPHSNDHPALRQDEARARNARIGAAARRHRFGDDARVPFVCECDDRHCDALIRLTLREYEVARSSADYLVAPGHQVGQASIVRAKDDCWLYAGERG